MEKEKIDIEKYRTITKERLEKIMKKKPIGEGTYSHVYPVNKFLVIKVLKNNSKKNIEADIHQILQDEIILEERSPAIPVIYQTFKYPTAMVIERLDTTLLDHTRDMISYIPQKRLNHYKSIILQTLLAIATLQKTFQGFRHNDLKINNILIDKKPHKSFSIKHNGRFYNFPATHPIVKLSDFDYANIPQEIHNPKVSREFSKTFGCTPDKSNIYDHHLFLNSFYRKKNLLPVSIVNFIESNIDSSLLGIENENLSYGRLKSPEKHIRRVTALRTLIANPIFDRFITKNPKNIYYS
jgi:hypothetical protein